MKKNNQATLEFLVFLLLKNNLFDKNFQILQ